MRNLFYNMVEMITETITGIDNDAMSLWELTTYLRVIKDVTTWLNVVIAMVIVACIIGVVLVQYNYSDKDVKTH